MISSSPTLSLLGGPDLTLHRAGARGLPAPRVLLAWWLAVALLTWVQLRHEVFVPLPDPAWRGLVALALAITIVSSVAGRSALEGVLLLVCAWAVGSAGGSGALVPLASVGAALAVAHPQDIPAARRATGDWQRALLPCGLSLLGLASWSPSLLPVPLASDPAAPAIALLFLSGVITLAWIHSRHCQGTHGSPYAGPICAIGVIAAAAHGLAIGELEHTVGMLLVLAMWLPLLLSAHQPSGNPITWWFRRGAITVSACALGCWVSLSSLAF